MRATKKILASVLSTSVLIFYGCFGNKFVSADSYLEEIYVGKSYYDIEADFGLPNATIQDGFGGTKIAYNSVSLLRTKASNLYTEHNIRNRNTKIYGTPTGGITFMLDDNMRCYAVDSDFQSERTKEDRVVERQKKDDKRLPQAIIPKIPRTLNYPEYASCSPNAEVVSIEKVEVNTTDTKIFFQYRVRTKQRAAITNEGIYVMPEVYIEDCATHKRYNLKHAIGITMYPDRTTFSHNEGGYDVLQYSLTFEPLATSTEFINIIEPGHSGYNYYRLDVRTPILTKEELEQL